MSIRMLPRPGIVLPNRGLVKPLWPFSINHDSPQAEGLHLWWPFIPMGANNAFGDVIEMVHGLDGLMKSGPNEGMTNANWLESDRINEVYPKLNFRGDIAPLDDNNSYVEVAESSLIDEDLENDEITVCALVLFDGFDTGDDPGIYSKAGGDEFLLGLTGGGDNRPRFRLTTSAATTDIAFELGGDGATSATSFWHWFIARYKNNNPFGDNQELLLGCADSASKYFGLSVEVSSNARSGTIQMQDLGATIGGRKNTGDTVHRAINAQMGDLRIYNRHVSDDVLEQMIFPRTRWDLVYPGRQRIYSIPAPAVAAITITPTPAVVNLNVPSVAVNRQIRPTPAVLNFVVPAAAVDRIIASTPAVLNLNLSAIEVNRLVLPDPVVLNLNIPNIAVVAPRIVTPTPAVLNLVVPAAAVDRIIASTPAVLNLVVPAAAVDRIIASTPAVLNLVVPAATVNRIIASTPAVLNLVVPNIAVVAPIIIAPTPAVLNLVVPTHRVNRLVLPDPVVLNLNVPIHKVNQLVTPDPVVLNLVVPNISVITALILSPDPAVLNLAVPNITIGGIVVPAFLVQLSARDATQRFNQTNTMVVFADNAADAIAMAKSQFDGDSAVAWDDAVVTQIVATSTLQGWRLRVVILDSTPVIEEEVTGVVSDQIDDLGTAMANALNANAIISGASYTAATQVLVIAQGSGTDDLGDKDVVVELRPPATLPGAEPIPGGVVSVTDKGASTDDLSATLAADSFTIPNVSAQTKRTDT